MTPYQTVVFDQMQESVLVVDMETGAHTEVPVAELEGAGLPGPIAVDSDGAIYVYYEIFQDGSLLAKLDPTMSQWTTMRIEGDIQSAQDMEFKPDGNLIVGGEFDVYDIDFATKAVQLSGVGRTGDFHRDAGTVGVEIDANGTVTTGALTVDTATTLIFRQAPDEEFVQRFDTGILLADFILDSDGSSLIGAESGSGTLYRLSFETKTVDRLFESDLLTEARRVELDPNGLIVVLTRPSTPLHRLLQIDLSRGTADLIAELEGYELSDMDLLLPPEGLLWAGDADQDLDFDQRDLVQALVASKYRTGQAATWGEGDWDGAPGGGQGNPPLGDGFFNQIDVVVALGQGHYLTGPYSAVQPDGHAHDVQTSIVYNAATGEVAVDAPAGAELTSINIDSAVGIFTGDAAQDLRGSFDNDADNNIFKATFGSSFGSLTFGNIAQPGLSELFLLGDLSVIGSLAGGGDLGEIDLIYVPEPTTVFLLVVGSLALVAFGRHVRSVG